MYIPYSLTPTPDGYEIEAYTRPAFMDAVNILVEGSSKTEALTEFIREIKKQRATPKEWPSESDWMPGDFNIEVN